MAPSSRIKTVQTICPYCGCGCKLNYVVQAGKIVKAEPIKDDPASQGRPCIKGLTSFEPLTVERLKYPMMRRRKDGPLRKTTWAAAFKYIKEKTKNLKSRDILFTGSGEYTNEDNYIMQKFARVVFKTNNIDCCARLCHASTVKAMQGTYGIGAMSSFMDDVLGADVILAVGTNPAHNYPVFFNRILDAKKKGAKLITVHAVPNATSKFSDIHINVPYESLTAFIAGLLNAVSIKSQSKIDGFFGCEADKKAENERSKVTGFEDMKKSISYLTHNYLSKRSGIDMNLFNRAVQMISESKDFVALHGMGLTQHANGTQNVTALLNLCTLKNGKTIPMRGKCNVQGAGDMGCCPNWAPFGGSRSMAKEVWGIDIDQKEGLKITEGLENNPVRAAYIMGMNPAQSMPNLNEVHTQLKSMFVIYQHHHPSETMKFADVVLPSAMLPEKDGTVTNAERRVRRVRKAIESPGKKQDWEIICGLAKEFGYSKQFGYKSADDIFGEIIRAVPEYAGLTWKGVSEKDNCFADKEERFKKFVPLEKIVQVESPRTSEYSFTLTTTRLQYHFCTGEATRRSKTMMKMQPKPVCKMNESDAKKLGIKTGDIMLIKSVAGEIKIEAEADATVPSGMLVAPYHFESVLINKVIPSHRHLDEITQTPNYKAIKVNVEKIGK
ncbi:MAG: molybdopterin-dependent oxidoreductase [Nanoarchaeota archaeon]|nr:molybdopterin-dependent oxidoreductase [Nanoarchaeota archaeon]MBU4300046.1 molybdopterin-dependent oxidoreductase [Nanoarchaeota archaeon]MBU4451847.1 molybdopterin-dependent oxidoreductase [Nanoarchaeota archaeon]MCG2724417.1 molybdopterin-dependent oxidoreductase [archaeon]